ncbi:RNA helicase, DEAD-box type, Q motif,Helicase, C-terminal,ATP-dependent RNA helicase DEAD-box, conserved [Cinara cedri]|uniref:RNA helicase n=1 Tax=Cinara cedri TaxID=506608 RepID=A0A5E4NP68_9HEMI|nr:RNA helicase, DEAD-box type, Q motif,Helicase, C-terminal,ATP-dependent RNA helicase DEAD-box, conserved [Cinara cedri]
MSFTVIDIEPSLAGLVIGRGGAKIKSIQKESGAIVKLINNNTDNTCVVKIIGSQEAQFSARDLVLHVTGGKVLKVQTVDNPNPPPRKKRGSDRPSSPLETFTITDEQWAEIERENEEAKLQHIASLPKIIKEFYVEHKEVTAMSDEDVNAFRLEKNNIMVNYVNNELEDGDINPVVLPPILKPVKTFHHAFHAYPEIMKLIRQQKFKEPSPIQCQAWPYIMSGHDLIAIAQTGTGKTLTYILPALINLMRQPVPREQRIGPYVLILGPTRELVLQIEEEVKKYVFNGIRVQSVYGGSDNSHIQISRLINDRPDIVAATPGRLNDLIGQKAINLEHVVYLVLDEADRMLDMGFKNQIELSLRQIRSDRQTVLTSATWPDSVKKLSKLYTRNPVQIHIGSFNLTTVDTVEQKIIVLPERHKKHWLNDFIHNKIHKEDRVIIFMSKKVTVEEQYNKFCDQNISCRCIHGGRMQVEREESLADMRNGVVNILIATDVAARGIDIPDINLVVNYDFPLNIEEYVHRVGRTGRAGRKGFAITLFSHNNRHKATELVDVLEKSNQPVPEELYAMVLNKKIGGE